MGTGMQQRHGTTAEWAAANRVLMLGEIGWDRLTKIFKIGDGATAWLDLKSAYVRTNGGDEIVPDAVGVKGLGIKGMVGQVADVFSALKSDGTGFRVDKDGLAYIGVDRLTKLTELTAETNARVAADTAETNARIADVDAEEAARIAAVNAANASAIQKAVITALGDILVGTGAGAVAKLAKGADGMLLTMVGGNVVWANAPASVDNSKVLKAGDTMTGLLILQAAAPSTGYSINFKALGAGGLSFYVRPRNGGGIEFVNNAQSAIVATIDDTGRIDGKSVYDNGNRVYSASNPPPISGAVINQTIRGTHAAATVTIPAVNMAKSQLRMNTNASAYRVMSTGSYQMTSNGLSLTSSTVITQTNGSGGLGSLDYELTEWT